MHAKAKHDIVFLFHLLGSHCGGICLSLDGLLMQLIQHRFSCPSLHSLHLEVQTYSASSSHRASDELDAAYQAFLFLLFPAFPASGHSHLLQRSLSLLPAGSNAWLLAVHGGQSGRWDLEHITGSVRM